MSKAIELAKEHGASVPYSGTDPTVYSTDSITFHNRKCFEVFYQAAIQQARAELIKELEAEKPVAEIDIEVYGRGGEYENVTVNWCELKGGTHKLYTRPMPAVQEAEKHRALRNVSTERLGAEFEKVLHDNLWELYESSPMSKENNHE